MMGILVTNAHEKIVVQSAIYFLQVLIQIVHVLLCCAPLWIGFTLAFVVIFDDVSNQTLIKIVLTVLSQNHIYNEYFR